MSNSRFSRESRTTSVQQIILAIQAQSLPVPLAAAAHPARTAPHLARQRRRRQRPAQADVLSHCGLFRGGHFGEAQTETLSIGFDADDAHQQLLPLVEMPQRILLGIR